MDCNNDETDSYASCREQNDHNELQSERIKKLEDNINLICNYVKRNNRRIHSLLLKVTPDSELLSGLLMEEDLPGTDGDRTAFDIIAKDSIFLDKITAQKQVNDHYKKIESSLEDLHQAMKEKDKQLKSMREELDTIGKTNSQHQAPTWNREGELNDVNDTQSESRKFSRKRLTWNTEGELNDVNDTQSESRKFSRKRLTWNTEGELNDVNDTQSESRKFSKKRLTWNEESEFNDTTETQSESRKFSKKRLTWNEESEFNDTTETQSESRKFSKKRLTWNEESELNDTTETKSESRKFSKKRLTWNEESEINNTTEAKSESRKFSKQILTRNRKSVLNDNTDTLSKSRKFFKKFNPIVSIRENDAFNPIKNIRENDAFNPTESIRESDAFNPIESIRESDTFNPENIKFKKCDIESSRQKNSFNPRLSRRTTFLIHNKKELEHHHLPRDTYSYLAVTEYFTGCVPTYAFCMAISVLCVQVGTLVIFAADVTNFNDRNNPISIPAGVGSQVRASQFIALLISCWSQDEICDSFNVFSLGYNEDKIRVLSRSATRVKWYFSVVVRILIGLLSLLVTFTLIVNSETVKDVMLDFAAVTFVSELDHANFRLSLWGYMGKTVQQLAVKIKKTSIYDGEPSGRLMRIPRLAWMFAIVCSIMGSWAYITAKQERGDFMDHTIFVQFGDGFSPAIGAFSGLYGIDLDNSLDGIRINYVEQQRHSATFSYCTQYSTWIFQYGPNPEQHYPSNFDYSSCWARARSSQTENLDITRTSQDAWFVFDQYMMVEKPLQHMFISGRRNYYGEYCESSRDCGERMHCEEDIGVCICSDGLFGLNCEFPEPCQTLEIDTRDPNGGFYGTRSWSKIYSSMQEEGGKGPLQVYGKPVYLGVDSTEGLSDVMIFNGRRWILMDNMSIEDYHLSSSDTSARSFVEFLASDFHAYWSNYTFYFASEPVDVGTPADSATPINLQWYHMKPSGTQGVSLLSREKIWRKMRNIEATLFCAVCNNTTNPCFYGATCTSEGICDCNTGSSGRLCQVPPSGNGLCDDFFNTPEFSFDGGDCCQETCTSTKENTCGQKVIENSDGISTHGFIGYPNCQDPRYSSKLSGSTTLYDVIERGTIRCGSQEFPGFLEITDGVYTGFEADLCRAIGAAALGDPEAIEIIETNEVDRFSDLSEGKFDVLLTATTFTSERDIYQSDSRRGFSFVPTPYFFDGLHYSGIPPFSVCANNLDVVSPECSNLRICVVETYSWLPVTERLFPDLDLVKVKSRQAAVDGLEQGLCNVIAGEIHLTAESIVRKMGFTGPAYELGNNVFSKEPLSAVTRQDDRVWFKFVSWIIEALVQAEESDITRLTANSLSTSNVFGEQFQNMFMNAVAASGNYGEIYQKNLEDKIARAGLNRINAGASGLIYSFPFGVYETNGPDPIVGGSIEAIRRRGYLNCGVIKTPGFAVLDPKTLTWHGFEVNMCQGIAAALLSGYPHVNFIPLSPGNRFRMLAEGAVDVMGWSTHTLTREVMEPTSGEAFDFTPSIFYDGMGFGGRPAFVRCAEDLASGSFEITSNCVDTRICVPSGTTWLEAMLNQLNIPVENVLVTDSLDSGYEEFISGNCNVLAGESAQISESTVREKGYVAKEDYVVGERKFTKEPLAIVSRSNDVQFSDFLRWIIFGFFFAAEEGITREKYFDMPINYLFGGSLSRMWQNAIQAVGNYDEMFETNFAGVLEMGGQNMLNDRNGPQLYAKPGVTIK